MIRSNTLFRTLTLVGIAILTFTFSASTIASGLSAQADASSDHLNKAASDQSESIDDSIEIDQLDEDSLRYVAKAAQPFGADSSSAVKKVASIEGTEKPQQQSETPKELHKKAQRRAQSGTGTPVMTAQDKREILWLARIVYSETKRPDEQRLIAWVVRNRVDTGYTGRTYESVANHASQFSGLHPSDNRYQHNMSRYWASQGESWRTALRIAKSVYFASESKRPFAKTTRHFYSPISVYDKPAWAYGREAVRVIPSQRHMEPRFAFYSQVR